MTSLIKRWQKKTIQEAIKTRLVLLLSGARQCGKTTLAKQVADKDTLYLTLDDLAMRNLAREDPHGFVKTRDGMLIIDEIQRAPDLLSAIKLVVDINTRPGQFLLTGSANLQSLPTVQESLAGRIRKVRLRTLSQGEIIGASPDFLKHAFNQSFAKMDNSSPDRQQLLNLAFRGGYPEILHFNEHECQLWHNDYISALLERDLADITKITQHSAMRELIQILAGWSGNYMDITAMSSKLSIRRPTIESYINALEALYLVERLAPWSKTDYERVGKQSKFYMCDSGIMTSLLRWHRDQIEYDPDRSGKLIETFILDFGLF